MAPMLGTIRRRLNDVLALADLEFLRTRGKRSDYRDYISFGKTVEAAKAQRLPVGDYIDAVFNVPGSTDATIESMAALGTFEIRPDRVCEIGPGSGRYLDRVYRLCTPSHYEIYETAEDWGRWLVSSYNVVWQPTDGLNLASTNAESMDLVHSHKVLPGQPSLTILRYLNEMARVVCLGGKVVFDIVTESCMDDDTVQRWWDAHSGYQHYPCLFPRRMAIDYLERRGLVLDGTFLADMKPGKTEYFVFTRRSRTR